MDADCLPHTRLPDTTPLFADYLYRFERVCAFYDHDPGDSDSFRAAAQAVHYPADRRVALVEALRELNGESPELEALARPETLVVATGQQVGLFAGPVYTIYKALTAIKLARHLSASGFQAVPVFWLASEDHDFDEVNHCWVFDAANRPVRIGVSAEGVSRRPVGGIPVHPEALHQLRQALAGFPSGEQVAALAADAYPPGSSFAQGFRKLLEGLLAPYGLLFVDPLHSAVRRLAMPVLERAVLLTPELNRSLRERGAELEAAGYHAQVRVEDHTSLLFLLEDGQRLPLRRQEGGFAAGGRRFSPEELRKLADRLSPNALLRPVVQDWVLPTVAAVVGPSEAAYLAQSQVIYRQLLGRVPVVVPRWSATLLDTRSARLMDRYGLRLEDFFRGEDALRERIAAALVPPTVRTHFEEASSQAGRLLDGLGSTLAEFDPTLEAALARGRRKILYQFSKTSRKAARETFRRDQRAQRDAAWLAALVYPHRRLQERRYSILPFLARHGPHLIARLYEEIRLDSPDHRVVAL